MKPIKYEIAIKLLGSEFHKSDLITLKKFTSIPISTINEQLVSKKLVLGTIVNEDFYSGVNEIIQLIHLLKSEYQLYSNNTESDIEFLERIAYKINNVKLSDLR